MFKSKQHEEDRNISLVELNTRTSSSSNQEINFWSNFFTTTDNSEETDNGERTNRSDSQIDKDEKIDYVYRTPNVNFSMYQFIVEFIVHVGFPFTFWYYPYTHKWLPFTLSPLSLYFNYLAPACFWIMLVMAINSKSVSYQEAFLPGMFYLNHRLMVSLKYGSLTLAEYKHMLGLSNPQVIHNAHQQIQIFDSWHGPLRFHVFEFEIMSAAIICGAELNKHYFLLPKLEEKFELPLENIDRFAFDNLDQLTSVKPHQLWSNYLIKNLKDHHYESILTPEGAVRLKRKVDGHHILPLTEFIRSLIEFGRKHTIKPKWLYDPAVIFYAIAVSFIPIIFRANSVIPIDSYGNAYYIVSFLVCFPFSMVNFFFLKYIILDVLERNTIAMALSRIIRAESINLCDDLWLEDMPTIDVSIEQNLYAWMYARLIMMNFGKRREFRRDIYMGTFLIIMGLLTLSAVMSFADAEDYDDVITILEDPRNIQVFVIIVVVFFMIEYFIYASAITNDEYRSHEDILMLNLIKLESNLVLKRRERSEDCTKMENSANSLHKMLSKVSKSNESYSLRIIGFEASLTVVWTVASTLFAMFFFVVAVIYDKMTGNPIFGNT